MTRPTKGRGWTVAPGRGRLSAREPLRAGLDALFPAFFVALLFEEARGRRKLAAAGGGAGIALGLTPLVPAGRPILAAAAAAIALATKRP